MKGRGKGKGLYYLFWWEGRRPSFERKGGEEKKQHQRISRN